MRPRITYFISQYPAVSHSFIRREILALEALGYTVQRIALRGWDADLVDSGDIAERLRTRYVLEQGAGALLRATLREALGNTARFVAALRAAFRLSRQSDRSALYHLIYLAEACLVWQMLGEFEPAHVHVHFGTNPTEVLTLLQVLREVPYSFTVHGPEEFDKPLGLHLREKIERSRFVVAISSFGRSQLYRWIDHRQWPKVQVVHCGLEQAFHDVPKVEAPQAPRLVCVGRLCEQKGQLLLVRAAAALRQQAVPFELVLAGDGPLRAEIEELVRELGIADAVRITGWLSSAQVREEILAARAMVLPSFAEGLPVVIMEAMALRRPVLTTYVAGIPELVRAGEGGWLFPAGDVDALAQAMRDCLATPAAELDRMGELARARVLERHDVMREAARLGELFERTIAAEGGPACAN